MNKKDKQRLEKKWWVFCNNLEDKIEDAASYGDGLFFILFLPIWFILKTLQWLLYLIGSWAIKIFFLFQN